MKRSETLAAHRAIVIVAAAAIAFAHGETTADTEKEKTPISPTEGLLPFSVADTNGGLSLHDDMYMLPATWSRDYEGNESEVVFQLSAKLRVAKTNLFFGYTQVAFWQAYNGSESRPFRETNYNPRVFYRITFSENAIPEWVVDFGVDHQSNGQDQPDSRSWNRAYATMYYQKPRHLLSLRLWYRFDEDVCPIGDDGLEEEWCRDDSGYDDNPWITDYMGYSEVEYRYRWLHRRRPKDIHVIARGNLATGKGGVGLDYSHSAGSKDLHWFAKAWHGYGESLADHDRSITRLGLGILFRRTYQD